jgi:hypothetical protein
MLDPRKFVIPSMTTTAGVQCKKGAREHRRWKRSQGRLILAFILTLDGVSSAHNRAGLEAKRFTAEFPTLAAGFAFVFFCS